MSRFSGQQFKGADAALRATRRAEAAQRAADATRRNCGHRHTDNGAVHCPPVAESA